MKEWKINLLNTDNTMLVGDVGEAIALHYLSSHGFFIVCRPVKLLDGELSLISAHHQVKPPKIHRGRWLKDKQKEYLEKYLAWDYVAFKLEGLKRSPPYLVEVKTIRRGKKPHKKPDPHVISMAKELGFKPIMITVKLLENWNVSVEAHEL